MPLECPKFTHDYNHAFSSYNACLDCGHRHGNECWYYNKCSVNLSDILTISERISILEDTAIKEEPPWTGKQWDEVLQLKAMVQHLQNKIVVKAKEKREKAEPF